MVFLRKKIIAMLMMMLGVLITPAGIYHSFSSQETHLEISHHSCCKEQKHQCDGSHQQNKCVVPCVNNHNFVIDFQATLQKVEVIFLPKQQNRWYYKNNSLQTVYFSRWVPPKFI